MTFFWDQVSCFWSLVSGLKLRLFPVIKNSNVFYKTKTTRNKKRETQARSNKLPEARFS